MSDENTQEKGVEKSAPEAQEAAAAPAKNDSGLEARVSAAQPPEPAAEVTEPIKSPVAKASLFQPVAITNPRGQMVKTQDGSAKEVFNGYQLKEGLSIEIEGEVIGSDNFNHAKALFLMNNASGLFRKYVQRAYYAKDDAYWQGALESK